MKKSLFGKNIDVDCACCDNFKEFEGAFVCVKGRQIKKGKCSKFSYNPTLRNPREEAPVMRFTKEDFEI